ncbi:MAG: hypothetical protein U9R79_11515 [Armatimonadota bacterium]|nr:hypothetical protein [Armatimonadota bacterium]
MKRLLQYVLIGLAIGVLLTIIPQSPAAADHSGPGHFYRPGPAYHVPPGHQPGHHKKWIPPGHRKHWIPPGHLKHMYGAPHGYRYSPERRYGDWRYRQGGEDYGLIIRKGPQGTTIDIRYRNRDW